MKVAVVGCIHGKLELIYEQITDLKSKGTNIELLIICGDFQTIRNQNDFRCISIPFKYRKLGTFYKYYFGELKAPVLTIFIGGNHEASNYLMTLPYGGWVAPNIYYLGYSNIINYKGLRIAGISGIYNRNDVHKGRYEKLPFNSNTTRSIYHCRHLEAYRFMSVTEDVDIFISHDWPLGIHSYGDLDDLLRKKPFFTEDINKNSLGNPLLKNVLDHLKPKYWFAAHLHVRFQALVKHTNGKITHFLALDKVMPNRKYFEVLDIKPKNESFEGLQYDEEWLKVLKITDEYISIQEKPEKKVPELWVVPRLKKEDVLEKVKEKFSNSLNIPENFVMSEPVLKENDTDPLRKINYRNHQTTLFCNKLDISDPIEMILDSMKALPNPNQISLSDDESQEGEKIKKMRIESSSNNQLFFIDKTEPNRGK